MTNFEKYKNEIFEILNNKKDIAIVYDKPDVCAVQTPCECCSLLSTCGSELRVYKLMEWATSEYKEKPMLTKRQHAFCEAFPNKWILKYCSESLLLFDTKPDMEEGVLKNAGNIIMEFPKELISFSSAEIKEKKAYSTNEMMTWKIKE